MLHNIFGTTTTTTTTMNPQSKSADDHPLLSNGILSSNSAIIANTVAAGDRLQEQLLAQRSPQMKPVSVNQALEAKDLFDKSKPDPTMSAQAPSPKIPSVDNVGAGMAMGMSMGMGMGGESKTADTEAMTMPKKRRRSRGEEVPMTFPQRLMEILTDESHSDIISWLPHGRGFMIYQKKRFAAEVMPKYFKKSKFTSFTRKLNRWNFTRITRGPETGAYYHEFFQKGNLRLCMQMCCQHQNLGTAGVAMASPPTMKVTGAPDVTAATPPPALAPGSGAPTAAALGTIRRFGLGGEASGAGGSAIGALSIEQSDVTAMQRILSAGGQPTQPHGLPQFSDANFLQLRELEQLQQQQQQQLQQQQQDAQQLAILAGLNPGSGGGVVTSKQQQDLAALASALNLGGVATGNSGPGAPNSSGITSATPNTSSTPGQPDVALGTLQRSNANAYLAMIMAQEKMQAQLGTFGGAAGAGASPLDMQRQQANFLQSQQHQLEQFNQQRLMQAALQQQQQQQQQQQLDLGGAGAGTNGGQSSSSTLQQMSLQEQLNQQQRLLQAQLFPQNIAGGLSQNQCTNTNATAAGSNSLLGALMQQPTGSHVPPMPESKIKRPAAA